MVIYEWPPIPRLWEGETVCIFGAGPSLTSAQVERVRGQCRTIAVNCSFRLAPWADVLYSTDAKWWEEYENPRDGGLPWTAFPGLKITQDYQVNRSEVIRIPGLDLPGLSRDQWHIHTGANSTYAAMNLAVHFGVKRVIFLGCDMRVIDGKTHFHPDHPQGMANPCHGNFQTWIQNFRSTLPDLKKAGVEVINATPGTALRCFPCMSLEEALQ
jgi:hypothetical protein